MTDKERLEIIKDKQLYMHSLSTFDISWLIEQAEQNIRRISKSFELDEFLRDYSDTADRQAALDEAYTIMNPHEKLNEIEQYVTSTLKRNVAPILKEDELNLLIYLAKKGLIVKQ